MNPIYKFIIKQKTSNLLNPYACYRKTDALMETEMIAVERNATYVWAINDSSYLPVMRINCYDASKQWVGEVSTVQNEFTIPNNAVFIQSEFPAGLNPFEMGIFKKPYTKFESFLTATVKPVYKDDLALEYAIETNYKFYRGKLSGELTFQMDDYAFIKSKAFDTQFDLLIYISYDYGATWTLYWSGQFWKTDCQFNEDDKTVIVTPNVNDVYNDVLAGMDKEFNLIELAPVTLPVKIDKRPVIQVYVQGQNTLGCFLSNMWWEQSCEVVDDEDELTGTYHFLKNLANRIVDVTGDMSPQIPLLFKGDIPEPLDTYTYYFDNEGFRVMVSVSSLSPQQKEIVWSIIRLSDNTTLWEYEGRAPSEPETPYEVTLDPVEGTEATGQVTLSIRDFIIYARLLSDKETGTAPIPTDDMAGDNRNYKRVCPANVENHLVISNELSNIPTEWGIYQPNQYYVMPYNEISGMLRCYPIARSTWTRISFWYSVSGIMFTNEEQWREEYTLKHTYPLYSVISVLLRKIAPDITHDGTTDYSQFLYGGRPLGQQDYRLFVTPKSNLIKSGYDNPAQKAPVTLRQVLDMLQKCYQCYWFIDSQSRFRIEHIEYFRNGGSYTDEPVVGIDLTQQIVTRNGKPWSYARKQYSFDKPEMAAWYQFGWMDDVTELFNGNPIEIVSKYVNPDNIEDINVESFSSDVDYILLSPNEVSPDGFALLAPVMDGLDHKLPYFTFTINHVDYVLQNAFAAFVYLQQFYRYDMPAREYIRNGVKETALGIQRGKNQTLTFPMLYDIDLFNLIKTSIGYGVIEKLTINLSSRNANATLKYDTE